MEHKPDDLAQWIATLRRRIEHGELTGLPPVHVDQQSYIAAGLVAQILLAELDGFADLTPQERDHVDNVVKHRSLLWDLLWLRQQIG
jgi:hypothetical protein